MEELLNVNKSNESKSDAELEDFYNDLLLKSQNSAGDNSEENQVKNYNSVKPTPGLCVKTKLKGKDSSKVFINICTSSSVPAPKTISEQELLEILDKYDDESDETVSYRVPMSIGEGHTELDNKSKACTAYDVIINPSFLVTIKDSRVFFGFLMSIVNQGIQEKYGIELDENFNLLRNKKFFGRVQEQRLRKKALIQEFSENEPLAKPQQTKVKRPRYVLAREPETGHPDFLVAEVLLKGVERASNVLVDANDDRLVINTRPKSYSLDIYLPFDLLDDQIGCQFDVRTQVLTVTMPVKPQV